MAVGPLNSQPIAFLANKGPSIIYGQGWAGKNVGGGIQNFRQFEGGGGHKKYASRLGGVSPAIE